MTRAWLAAAWLTATSAAWAVGPDGGVALRYLALGDSFTIGTGGPPSASFPAQLKRRLAREGLEVRLENVAVNGYSTEDLIEEELPALAAFKPDTVTLAVGANDLVRGDDLPRYRANLRRIFAAIAAAGVSPARTFVLPQPDWSRAPVAGGFGDRAKLHARIEAYNQALAEEARAAGAVSVDLGPLLAAQAKRSAFAPDGLHPDARAYAEWAEALAPRLAPASFRPR